MFYSTHMLGRKGPLAVIWIAAHKDPKFLKRAFVDTTDVDAACQTIMFPEAPLALRLSGQLVLGVVRVYYRQLEFLDDDAAAAFTKLLKAEKKGNKADDTTMAPDAHTAVASAIDLPAVSALSDLDYEFVSHDLDHLLDDVTPGPTPSKRGLQPEERRTSFLLMHEDSQHSGMNFLNRSQNLGEIDRFEKAAAGFEPDALDFDNFSGHFDTPEVVRAAPADEAELQRGNVAADLAASTPLFNVDGGPDMGGNDMDIDMPVPTDGPALEHVDTPALVAPPSSITKSADDAPAVLPGLDLQFDAGEPEQPQTARGRARDATLQARRRRMRAAEDVATDGAPAVQLPRAAITSLLKDRAALMRGRGADSNKRLKLALPPHAVVLQSSAAESNPLFRMASYDTLAPQMYAQVRLAMGPVKVNDMAPPPPRRPARSAAAADGALDPIADDDITAAERQAEAGTEAEAFRLKEAGAVGATPMCDGYDGGANFHDGMDGGFSGGGFDDGGGTATLTAGGDDPIEADMPEVPLQSTSRRTSLQLSSRSGSVAPHYSKRSYINEGTCGKVAPGAVAEEEDPVGQADKDKLQLAKWLHGTLLKGKPAVLSKSCEVMKGKLRLFQARAFYATLALQAQDSAPVAISQEFPLGDITVTKGPSFASWQPAAIHA